MIGRPSPGDLIPWDVALRKLGYSDVEIGKFARENDERRVQSMGRVEGCFRGFFCSGRFTAPLQILHRVRLLERGLVYGIDLLRELVAHARTLRDRWLGVKR